jgi:hypothetical protein
MHTKNGQLLISIILGIGAASIFRKICTETNCLDFRGPDLKEVNDSIYSHNDLCYKFTPHSVTCNTAPRQIQL